jgi:hypothetical protein
METVLGYAYNVIFRREDRMTTLIINDYDKDMKSGRCSFFCPARTSHLTTPLVQQTSRDATLVWKSFVTINPSSHVDTIGGGYQDRKKEPRASDRVPVLIAERARGESLQARRSIGQKDVNPIVHTAKQVATDLKLGGLVWSVEVERRCKG